MQKTILQVPVDKRLKKAAEDAASDQGFSSLQEALRIFMTKLATRKIEVGFEEKTFLSPAAEKRYQKIDQDFISKKNIYQTKDVDDLLTQLGENSIS